MSTFEVMMSAFERWENKPIRVLAELGLVLLTGVIGGAIQGFLLASFAMRTWSYGVFGAVIGVEIGTVLFLSTYYLTRAKLSVKEYGIAYGVTLAAGFIYVFLVGFLAWIAASSTYLIAIGLLWARKRK